MPLKPHRIMAVLLAIGGHCQLNEQIPNILVKYLTLALLIH